MNGPVLVSVINRHAAWTARVSLSSPWTSATGLEGCQLRSEDLVSSKPSEAHLCACRMTRINRPQHNTQYQLAADVLRA